MMQDMRVKVEIARANLSIHEAAKEALNARKTELTEEIETVKTAENLKQTKL